MNRLDRVLQDWRIRRALPWIPPGARVLDVGCFDDSLFRRLGPSLEYGVGLDALLLHPTKSDRFQILRGAFPGARPSGGPFDVITMLAVLEHVPPGEIDDWVRSCSELLVPGGLVVATAPAPSVDWILDMLIRLRILHGMEVDQHHGFEPDDAVKAFQLAGFALLERRKFQLGLNNLFVFQSPDLDRQQGHLAGKEPAGVVAPLEGSRDGHVHDPPEGVGEEH